MVFFVIRELVLKVDGEKYLPATITNMLTGNHYVMQSKEIVFSGALVKYTNHV